MSEGNEDTKAILLRRRMFVATVVTSLSCRVEPERARVVHAGPGKREEPPVFPLDNPVPPDPEQPLRSWAEVSAPMPPLAQPSSRLLSTEERADLGNLEKEWLNRYAELEKLWTSMPILCRVRDCPEDWRTFNAALDRQDGYIGEVGPGACGYSWSEGISRRLRNERHATFLKQLTVELRSHMLSRVVASGDVEFYRKIDSGPRVRLGACLQCMLPPVVIAEVATFDPGAAELIVKGRSLLEGCARLLTQHPERIHRLRGHAEATDDGADALALSKKRAEALRAALIEQGVKSGQLEVVAFGAAIPIGTPGEAINRRVEIEPKTRWQ